MATFALVVLLAAASCGGGVEKDGPRTIEASFVAEDPLPESAARTLQARIDAAGLDDASFATSKDRRTLTVQVPDSGAGRAVLDGLSSIGVVEFRPVLETGTAEPITPSSARRPDSQIVLDGTPEGTGRLLLGPSALPEKSVSTARAEGEVITVVFTPAGTDALNVIAGANLGNQLAIVVDGEVLSAPTLQSAAFESEVSITGQFSRSEAKALAEAIAGGPVTLRRRSG